MDLLSSPRRRRRLAVTAAAATVAAGLATAAIVFDGGRQPQPPAQAAPAGVGRVEEARYVRLTPAVRRSINATLERFVPAALSRRRPGVAWELAGPGLRAGTTKSDWLRGDLPVHPYPWSEQPVDGWRLIYAQPDQVAVDLLVQPPKRADVGAIVWGIDLVRRERRWLVNSIFPAAVFTPPSERAWVVGAMDFRAESSTAKSFYERKSDRARLSPAWLAVPGSIFAAVLLIPVVLGLWGLVADRRAWAKYAASRSRELPPLPRTRELPPLPRSS